MEDVHAKEFWSVLKEKEISPDVINVEHLDCAVHSFVLIYEADCNHFLVHMAYHHGQIFLTS